MHPLMKLVVQNKKRGFFSVENMDHGETTLYVYDVIVSTDDEAEYWGGISPEAFIKALNDIKSETIHIRYNTPGGDVFAARAMEQAIKDHPAHIVSHVDGYAASAGSYMALAGDEVIINESGFFMIHKAWTFAYGNSDDLLKTAELLDQIDGTLISTYHKATNQKPEDIEQWMKDETWIGGARAVELGFADSIAEEKPKAKAKAWDMSAYAHAPEIENLVPDDEPEPPENEPENKTDLGELLRQLEYAEKAA